MLEAKQAVQADSINRTGGDNRMEHEQQTDREIRISVRELVEFILRSGDIDNRKGGGLNERQTMQEGGRIHRKIQGKMGADYRAEVPLSITLPGDGYELIVEGRADGIFSEEKNRNRQSRNRQSRKAEQQALNMEEEPEAGATFWIDEIKGTYRELSFLEQPYPVHLAQAKCYAYIYARQQELDEIGVQMTYCNMETEDVRRFREQLSFEELERWFCWLTGQYRKWAELQNAWHEVRRASLCHLDFPFSWRPGQKELAQDVYRTILREKTLFLQAPTGTGKTLSTVYPAVRALGENLADRIFYATAKTVTRKVAEEAFALLRENGMHLKTITLTAKEKICMCEEANCNPEDCPYAEGHFDRVNDAVFELISSGETFDRGVIQKQAEKYRVCPFELSLDAALWMDGIICDYNYIFDPRAKLKRFFAEGKRESYLFLIDEAHNLVDRGREMFSASICKEDFREVREKIGAGAGSRRLSRALSRCNDWLLEQKRESDRVQLQESVGMLPIYLMNLCGEIEEYLEEPHEADTSQRLLELYFSVRRFLDVCDRLDENYVIYSEIGEDGRYRWKLFCVDISSNIQECLARGRSTVFFSATFLPIQYYKRLLSTETDNYAIYAKPSFSPEKRLVLIGTDTSSRYTNRNEREYRKMAQYIQEAVRAKRGNYMVFVSSYQMLAAVEEQFARLCEEKGERIETVRQEPGMTEPERELFLEQFEQIHPEGLVGFCVLGGIFGEGIDLREERLIGAIVIGTGLPQVCTERELLKGFYDRRSEDGFFYAYLCPGMNKVLQSAGRVIRTDMDEGVILLLDERFANRSSREMFPAEWQNPPVCTLHTVQQRLAEFWEEREDGKRGRKEETKRDKSEREQQRQQE